MIEEKKNLCYDCKIAFQNHIKLSSPFLTVCFTLCVSHTNVAQLSIVCFDRCPCTNFFMYSLVMMVGPALFLLGIGFMMSGGFWQSILKTSRLQHAKERCNYRMKSLTRLFQPFLAPMAYITIALMRGDFVVCSSLGSLCSSCYNNNQDKDILQVRKKHCPRSFQLHSVG